MITRLLSFILTLTLVACSSQNNENIFDEQRDTSNNFKIMTFNIFGGFPRGSDRNNINDYGLDAIIETIKNSNSQIIGLNEISNAHKAATNYDNQTKLIAEALGYYYDFFGLEVDRKYGLALLSEYPILDIKHTEFEIQGEHLKGYIEAKINHPDGEFWVIVTHLESGTDDLVRHYQILELKKQLNALKDYPVVLLGDLNFTPDSNNHNELTSDPNGFIDPLGKSLTPNTFSLANPKRIDYIVANNNVNFVNTPWSDTEDKTSDHFPVWANINFFLP